MPLSRRALLKAASAVAFSDSALGLAEKASARFHGGPEDEDYWGQIQQAFTLDRTVANFNNGGVSPSPRIVLEALKRYQDYSNQAPSYLMWRHLEPEIEHVRSQLGEFFGVDPEETAIMRNASEALETCLLGFDLEPGDEFLTTDQDYPRMITTLQQHERRHGTKLVQVKVPAAPTSHREIVSAFESGLTSRTKMILVSQVVFMTGQINPVRQIVALGRRNGIPVIVDGAHAFAQFPFQQKELDCDYFGTSLHKWLMAPIGTGMLYVKKSNIKGLWPLMAAPETLDSDIRKYEEIGTHPAANHNAIAEALTFNKSIGVARKSERLRSLRRRWTEPLSRFENVVFHTNLNPAHSCAICTVQIKGIEPGALADWLLTKKGIFVTGIEHPSFKGIRVSPNVYTTLDEIDRLKAALTEAATSGIPGT
ncbi:MAG: aminotransferase class V-fold PLP-dependent enzyme [Chthonomonadaceae bacterium]|nr:aminotransferase class V-fold PLP-dependent enzyme [Chthonomonadaceae bacterium]